MSVIVRGECVVPGFVLTYLVYELKPTEGIAALRPIKFQCMPDYATNMPNG